MTKRVVGVFAALVLGGSALACSSSSNAVTPTDAGPKDTGADVKTDAGPDTRDTMPPEKVYPSPGTTGNTCMTHPDCDPDGEEIGYCTKNAFLLGPLNPTPVCLLYGPEVCNPSTDTEIRFCDIKDMKAGGVCSDAGEGNAQCSPHCILKADGTWEKQCAGNNACIYEAITNDYRFIGTCQGGCQADMDCPTGSKCDPALQYCVKSCTTDTNCTMGWPMPPAEWKCNTTRGACEFQYAKKTGDTCAASADCLICFKGTMAAAGYCTNYCKTGGSAACTTGFTCDHLLDATDAMGAPAFTFTTTPAGLNGFCLRNCTDAAGCTADEVCAASAGMTQKTCRPKPTP